MLTKLLPLAALAFGCVSSGVSAQPSLTSLAPPLVNGHPAPAPNDNCDVNIGGFGPATSVAVAYGQGFFNALGVKPCYYKVTGSSAQFNEFFFGQYDLVQTALDNMMNRFYNGQPTDAGLVPVNITLLANLELQPSLTLIAAHGIEKPEDFNGKTLFVDAVDSGLLYAAQEILAIHGQYVNTNYDLFPCGGVRFPSVISGSCKNGTGAVGSGQATLISGADLVNAKDPTNAFNDPSVNGKIIARVSDYLATAGTSLGTKPEVLADPVKGPAVQKTLLGILFGHRFAQNPANAAAVTANLATLSKVNSGFAAQLYAQATDKADGLQLIDDLHVDQTRLTTMFDLRYKYGGFQHPLNDFGDLFEYGPGHFIDYTSLDAAAADADSLSQVNVNLPASLTAQCWDKNQNKPVVISNVISLLSSYVSGGCLPSANTISFVSLTSNNPSSRLSDFVWDGTNFKFTPTNDDTTFTAVFNVFQACSSEPAATITQTYSFLHGKSRCQ